MSFFESKDFGVASKGMRRTFRAEVWLSVLLILYSGTRVELLNQVVIVMQSRASQVSAVLNGGKIGCGKLRLCFSHARFHHTAVRFVLMQLCKFSSQVKQPLGSFSLSKSQWAVSLIHAFP